MRQNGKRPRSCRDNPLNQTERLTTGFFAAPATVGHPITTAHIRIVTAVAVPQGRVPPVIEVGATAITIKDTTATPHPTPNAIDFPTHPTGQIVGVAGCPPRTSAIAVAADKQRQPRWVVLAEGGDACSGAALVANIKGRPIVAINHARRIEVIAARNFPTAINIDMLRSPASGRKRLKSRLVWSSQPEPRSQMPQRHRVL
jgi:hypothetical protein